MTAADAKIDAIIREVAGRHGIALGRDDPILILQTINERLMQDGAAAQQQMLERFKEEMEGIAGRWGEDARNKAERTLNAAVVASRELMMKSMQEGAKAASDVMRREAAAALAQLAAPVREAKRVALMNMVAAGLTVVAAGVATWVWIAH